ncbi:MAG: hypothetical protein ACTSQI_20515 [Candidatus Helarchaeota archaeon]
MSPRGHRGWRAILRRGTGAERAHYSGFDPGHPAGIFGQGGSEGGALFSPQWNRSSHQLPAGGEITAEQDLLFTFK